MGLAPVADGAGERTQAGTGTVTAPVDVPDPLVDGARATSEVVGPPDLSGLPRPGGGEFLVGADRASLAPDEDRWQTEGCSTYASNFPEETGHLAGRITEDMVLPGWPKSPDCVYLGGYGLGPSRPATGVDPTTGYDVQTVAISNGDEIVVWQQTPFVGFFSTYRDDLCEACGILDIRRAIAEGLGGRSMDGPSPGNAVRRTTPSRTSGPSGSRHGPCRRAHPAPAGRSSPPS